MIAVVSFTNNPLYSFFAPIVNYAWNKIGVDCHFIIPFDFKKDGNKDIWDVVFSRIPSVFCTSIYADQTKMPTYSQVSRLYLASECADDDILISSDADMVPFNSYYFDELSDGRIHVVGNDLCPENQYPMCYCAMTAKKWKETMKMGDLDIQQMLDLELGGLQSITFRGDFWSRDQWLLFNNLQGHEVIFHPRAKEGTQFAANRVDRDNMYWYEDLINGGKNIMDAHLWRPGYTEENVEKIIRLFTIMYPHDSFEWIREYAAEFRNAINQ